MAGNLIQITDAGRAALVAAGNTGTAAHKVTQIGLGTATFTYKPDMKALPNELKRITTFGGDTVAKDTIHLVIQDDTADQYKLYAFGLYLDNGVLFGVYVQKDPILEKAAASMLLLAADTVFKTIDVTKLEFGPATFLNPPATTERQGVIEIATQAEVDAGTDSTRALTPHTAAKRFAPLASPAFVGTPTITSIPSDNNAQLSIKAQSGATNRAAKLRFFGTFGTGADTNTRFVASIRSGFEGGTWGKEYVDVFLNKAANETQSDANQARALRLTYGGRAIVGNLPDDGKTALQVGGSARAGNFLIDDQASGNSGVFGFTNANGPAVALYGSGTSGSGSLVLKTAGVERARVTSAGRLLLGSTADDGTHILQVAGNATVAGELRSTAATGLRVVRGDYGVLFRNDGASAFLLQTNAKDQYGNWNSYRPLQWNLSTGQVYVDQNGSGTKFGGRVMVGSVSDDGSNTLQVGGSIRAVNYLIGDRKAADQGVIGFGNSNVSGPTIGFYGSGTSGHGSLVIRTGDSERARVTEAGHVVIGSTSDDGSNTLQVAGTSAFSGRVFRGGKATIETGILNGGIQNFGIGDDSAITSASFADNAWGAALNLGKSRGTKVGTHGAVRAGDVLGTVRFVGSTGAAYVSAAAMVASAVETFSSTASGSLLDFFTTSAGSAASSRKMRITDSGRVLIGTTGDDGQSRLQVNGDVSIGGRIVMTSRMANMEIGSLTTEGTPYFDFHSSGGNVDYDSRILASGGDKTTAGKGLLTYYGGMHRFMIAGSPKLTINTGGRVLVGTAVDNGVDLVQVAGPLSATGSIKSSASITGIGTRAALTASNGNGTGQTSIYLRREGAAKDEKSWEMITDGSGAFALRAIADDFASSQSAMTIVRPPGGGMKLSTMKLMSNGGRVLIGGATDDGSSLLRVGGIATATAPLAGDKSDKLITSAWLVAELLTATIGQIVWEVRANARAGFLKLNGAELKRADYPALWAYAQASGAIVSDADWKKDRNGCYSTGDGSTTFRIPELRGEFIRCWDDGRGIDASRLIGSSQDSQNRSHAHGASAAAVGDHVHGAWTDAQGFHAHGIKDGGHDHETPIGRVGVVGTSYGQGNGPYNNDRADRYRSSRSGSNISISADGNHGHNVGIGGAGNHTHAITVASDGGNEARPRNIALQPMIRAY
ncbi:phage tail protein [Burkholderia sp. IMCC1007]|uniref:phage tail protein n=1 Tax=Burkholderia sp. IMCC1007 TaxID=3004104 RepID=UPI0022B2C68E|nr:hypothetical protein [Burkholderia sp. IMCC1007]